MPSQQTPLDQGIIGTPDQQTSSAHARLTGDYPCIFCIVLGFAAAAAHEGLVYCAARQNALRLAGSGQYREKQTGTDPCQVHRLRRQLQGVNVTDEVADVLLVVEKRSRRNHRPRLFDHHSPVMLLADIKISPQQFHPLSPVFQQAVTAQIPISSPRQHRHAERPLLSSRTTRPATHMAPPPPRIHPYRSTK